LLLSSSSFFHQETVVDDLLAGYCSRQFDGPEARSFTRIFKEATAAAAAIVPIGD
jgi:hypothetical protein